MEVEMDVSTALTQYGPLGIFTILLLILAKALLNRVNDISTAAYQRESTRADKSDAEIARLNTLIQEKVVIALTSSTKAIEANMDLLNAMQRERERQRLEKGAL